MYFLWIATSKKYLNYKEAEVLPIKIMKNGRSQKFRNNTVEVSVNPDNGNIIQVNSVHTKRKKAESWL